MLAVMFLPFALNAQTMYLTVADSTATNSYVPVYGNYMDDPLGCQSIYPESMLTDMIGENILSLHYYVSSGASTNWGSKPMLVKMMIVTEGDLSNGYIDVTNATVVYNGTISAGDATVDNGFTVDFTTPFMYTGGNLLISFQINPDDVSGYTAITWLGKNMTGASRSGYGSTNYDFTGTGTIRNFLPKTTFTYGAAPTCFKVSNQAIDATLTTANSLTLTWTDALNTGATYNIYDMSDTSIIETGVAGTTYTAMNLDANTAYTFGIETNCGDGDIANGYAIVSGRTACAAQALPWTCGFEEDEIVSTSSLTALPWCSERYTSAYTATTHYPYSYSSSSYAHDGSRVLYFYGSTGTTYPDTMALILPEIDVNTYPMNANRMTFWARSSSSSIDKVLYIYTMSNTTDINSATLVDSVVVTGTTHVKYSVSLANVPATNAYLVLMATKANGYLIIDDLTIEEMPSCMEVSNLTVVETTSSSITISWDDTQNPDGTTYTVYDMSNNSNTNATITGNVAVIDNLIANTQYTFGVQANCPSGDAPIMTVSGRTNCAPEGLPFSETFDASLSGNPCWGGSTSILFTDSVVLSTGSIGWSYTSTVRDGLPAGHYYKNVYGTTTKSWMVTPVIDLTNATSPLLSFDAALTKWNSATPAEGNIDDDRFLVIVSTDGQNWYNANATSINLTSLIGTSYLTQYVDLSNYIGQNIRIAFYCESTVSGGDNDLHIDNIQIEESTGEICYPVTNLAVSNITTNEATLTWNGDANSYNVYTITGTDTTFATNVSETSISFTGLNANTHYIYGVTSVCTNSESPMITVAFNTACAPIELPYTETFDETSATRNCWDLVSNNTANVGGTNGMDFVTVNNREVLRFSSYSTASDYNQYGYSPLLVASSSATALNVNIVYATYGANDKLNFGYVTATDTVWNATEYSTTGSSNWQTINLVIPANATQLAVHYYGSYSYYAWIDSVTITELTGDYCYAVTNLNVGNTTTSSVSLSWTDESNTGSTYTVYNGTEVVATNVATTSYVVTGLAASTAYTFGVVANCSATDASDMVTVNAMTSCDDVTSLPYFEGFENGLGCWTTVNSSTDGMPWFAASAATTSIPAHSGDGMAMSVSYYSGAVHANTWLISPKLVLPTTTDSLTLSWWHRVSSYYPTELYDVLISTTTNDIAAFTTTLLAVSPDSTNEYIQNIVDLTPYAGQPIYLAFHHHDSYDQNYLVIDDIEVFQGGYVPPAPDTLTVTFAVNDPIMGTTNPAPGTYQYITGDTIYFAASANIGYHFSGWQFASGNIIDTISATYISAYAPANVWMTYGNITLTALFEAGNPDSTTITYAVNDPTMGTLTPAPGTYTIYVGNNITVEATPNAGYTLSAWVFDTYLSGTLYNSDTILSTHPSFNNPMNFGTLPQSYADYNATITITALFESGSIPVEDSLIIHLTINNPTLGTINPLPGTYHVALNDSLVLSATPAAGATFDGWKISFGTQTMGTIPFNPFTFPVNQNNIAFGELNVVAMFSDSTSAPDSMTVIINTADATMGTTNPAPGTYNFAVGSQTFVTAIPNDGYQLLYWIESMTVGDITVTDTLLADTIIVNVIPIMAGITSSLTACFEAIPVQPCAVPTGLTATAIHNESIELAWDNADVEGWNIQYRVVGSSAFSSATSSTNTYTITNLNGDTDYEIQVQADCGDDNVSDWSDFITVHTSNVGIVNWLENSVVLFPNPAREYVDIRIDGDVNVTLMEVFDVYGKLINTINVIDNPTRINVNGLANGMYFVRVTTDNGMVTKTFVKK